MIDQKTGILSFDDGETIGPLVTRTAFLASALGEGATVEPSSVPYSLFTLTPRVMDTLLFCGRSTFHGETLLTLSLWIIDSNAPRSWDDWSLEKEHAAQARNEAWLARILGPPHESFARGTYPDGKGYRFEWGVIQSSYDPRSATTSLIVSYAKQP